jgi:hypothetical protein
LENVDKTRFASTEYDSTGGYNGNGGFVFYFNDSLTFEQADLKYENLIADGLFDKEYLSTVFEIMLYNENLQAGVIVNYEFLYNNAGKIDKTISTDVFYSSKYQGNFAQFSDLMIFLLYSADALYCICLLAITYYYFKDVIPRLTYL